MNQRIRFIVSAFLITFLITSSVCQAGLVGSKRLIINFTDAKDAKSKASWVPADKLTITNKGLGWGGNNAGSYDGRIQTKPISVGYAWRTPFSMSVRVTIQPRPSEIILQNGQKMTPYTGDVYVRYSPDLKHWSSWIVLEHNKPQSREEKKTPGRHFKGTIRIPYMERLKYTKLLAEYSALDVPWKSDEEAAVRWILKRQPNFFVKTIPFMGYVEFLYEGSIYGGQRIKSFSADVGYAMSGMHSPPKNEKDEIYKKRFNSPWSFKAEAKEISSKLKKNINGNFDNGTQGWDISPKEKATIVTIDNNKCIRVDASAQDVTLLKSIPLAEGTEIVNATIQGLWLEGFEKPKPGMTPEQRSVSLYLKSDDAPANVGYAHANTSLFGNGNWQKMSIEYDYSSNPELDDHVNISIKIKKGKGIVLLDDLTVNESQRVLQVEHK